MEALNAFLIEIYITLIKKNGAETQHECLQKTNLDKTFFLG